MPPRGPKLMWTHRFVRGMAAVDGLGPQVAWRKEVLRGQLQWAMGGSQRRLKPAVKAGSQQRARAWASRFRSRKENIDPVMYKNQVLGKDIKTRRRRGSPSSEGNWLRLDTPTRPQLRSRKTGDGRGQVRGRNQLVTPDARTHTVLKPDFAQNCPEGLLKHNRFGVLDSGCLG